MSLDVYLIDIAETKEACTCERCGNSHEHVFKKTLYRANITHNLGRMADACGIYECLWRPDEHDITNAEQLIIPLNIALQLLISNPVKFKKFNASNGWGVYDHFVKFVAEYLEACREYPLATVEVSR